MRKKNFGRSAALRGRDFTPLQLGKKLILVVRRVCGEGAKHEGDKKTNELRSKGIDDDSPSKVKQGEGRSIKCYDFSYNASMWKVYDV
jgi:hypothetical protein